MIQLTDSAKEYLTSMTESERKRFAYLSVLGGGCSGFQYKWDMIDDEKDGIVVEDILVVDKIAEMFVLGCTVDYVKEFGGSYLKVVNPNATAQCGCGESFAVENYYRPSKHKCDSHEVVISTKWFNLYNQDTFQRRRKSKSKDDGNKKFPYCLYK